LPLSGLSLGTSAYCVSSPTAREGLISQPSLAVGLLTRLLIQCHYLPSLIPTEPDRKLCGLARLAVEDEVKLMTVQDLLHHCQADALAVLLSTEKGREEVFAHFGSQAAAGVFNRDEAPAGFIAEPQGDAAIFANRFHRVLADVDEGLLHLPPIHQDFSGRSLYIPHPCDAPALTFRLHQPPDVFEQLPHVAGLQLRRGQARDVGETAHESIQLIRARNHDAECGHKIMAVFAPDLPGVMQAGM